MAVSRFFSGWRCLAPLLVLAFTHRERVLRDYCCASPWRYIPARTPGEGYRQARLTDQSGSWLRPGASATVTVATSVVLLRILSPDSARLHRRQVKPATGSDSPAALNLLGRPAGDGPVDIHLPVALMFILAAAYAQFWTLCVQRVEPVPSRGVVEVLGEGIAEEEPAAGRGRMSAWQERHHADWRPPTPRSQSLAPARANAPRGGDGMRCCRRKRCLSL